MNAFLKQWDDFVNTANIMFGTKANHMLGDISRDNGDFIVVRKTVGSNYIGEWLTGYGFIDVQFPVDSCRNITDEERAWLLEHPVTIG